MTSTPMEDVGPPGDMGPLDDMGPELPPPAPPARKSSRRAWWWVAGGLLFFFFVNALVVAAVAGDWMVRSYEADRLVTRIEASEAAMIAFQSDVAVAYATLGDPQQATDEQVAKTQEMLAAAVDSGLAAITEAGQGVDELPILPWHDANERAQAAYLAHNHAWQDYLTAAQADPAELERDQPEVDDTFVAAEPKVRGAVADLGPVDLFDLGDRVAVIFAPPQQEPADAGAGDGLLA